MDKDYVIKRLKKLHDDIYFRKGNIGTQLIEINSLMIYFDTVCKN